MKFEYPVRQFVFQEYIGAAKVMAKYGNATDKQIELAASEAVLHGNTVARSDGLC